MQDLEGAKEQLLTDLAGLDSHLQAQTFLVGDAPSLADVAVAVDLRPAFEKVPGRDRIRDALASFGCIWRIRDAWLAGPVNPKKAQKLPKMAIVGQFCGFGMHIFTWGCTKISPNASFTCTSPNPSAISGAGCNTAHL